MSINSSTICKEDLPFSVGLLWHLHQKSIECICVDIFWDFLSVPPIYLSIRTLKKHLLDYCSFIENLEDRWFNSSNSVFVKIILAILAPLNSNVNFRISLSTYTKTCVGILIEIMIYLQISLEKECQSKWQNR